MQSLLGVFIILMSVMLASCVSETTGGFNQANPEETLDVYLQLALGYVEQQDLSQARRHLANASEIDPNNSDIYDIWGLVYTLEGDLNLADESFMRALRMDSENSQVRNNYAAFLYSNGRFQAAYDQLDDAEYAFNRAIQLKGNRIRSTLELSDISLQQGNIQDAGRYYQSFLTLRQFFNVQQNARSLWVGIKLEQARGLNNQILEYGANLAELYPDSAEYALYQELLND